MILALRHDNIDEIAGFGKCRSGELRHDARARVAGKRCHHRRNDLGLAPCHRPDADAHSPSQLMCRPALWQVVLVAKMAVCGVIAPSAISSSPANSKQGSAMAVALPAHIHSTGNLPKVAWAKGSYVHDADGKRYIDGSGGPAVYCIGHSNEEVNTAITAQLERIAHGYRYNFTSDALEELTAIIRERAGGSLQHMVYVTGGSEAVESCLKLALQYHAARGEMSRRRFIARERSWHGNTLGALSVSGFHERKK
ncbi:MAG: aminotransferase class III-fold pyridoxal phosphate-dependent enzyme, partial [Alphaproteobacteria bacterium]|nr:aminotransferase class III-fold pyridoxal phosphate-dependent enzyme [Alphaproteobacteria bacterium]